MSLAPTAQAAPVAAAEAQGWVVAELHRALADTRHSLAELAAACGKSAGVAEGWGSGAKHFPVYALANARVPRSVRGRIVAALARRLEESAVRVGLDAATATLLARAGETIAAVGAAWSDRVLDAGERATLRPLVAALGEACSRWLREDCA